MAKQERQEVKVNFPESLRGGSYANYMVVRHTDEEFVMDFMMILPPAGQVVSRIVLSPSHVKRVLSALKENIEKYEKKHGELEESEGPPTAIGFAEQQ